MFSFKKLFFVFLMTAVLAAPVFSFASDLPIIILFHGEECPHCQAERVFLDDLKKEMPGLEIVEYEVWHNEQNQQLFLETAQRLGIKQLAVPLTIIGDNYLVGFDTPENSGEKIREMIKNGTAGDSAGTINLPFIGKINPQSFSLPALTVILGILDGFNPCSMWSLLVLITLAVATRSRKKVWIVGGAFILTSYFSYFIFMSAWLNTFIFLNYLTAIRIIVGLIAVGAGVLFIKEFYTFKPDICEVSSPEKQRKIYDRIKKAVEAPTILMLVAGVVVIAFSVNLIELLCSLGLPVIFTKALASYNLATWKYYAYIGLYDFFYMLDDIAVLAVAGFSLRFMRIDGKYSRYSRLAAGVLMIILGLVFLFKPEFLMFK